jgi:hypothetical protein
MSVVYPADASSARVPEFVLCFGCGKSGPPAVKGQAWVCGEGDTDVIVLHPTCAERLAVSLLGDSREATLSGDQVPVRRRPSRGLKSCPPEGEVLP